jgi:hypothetical protein
MISGGLALVFCGIALAASMGVAFGALIVLNRMSEQVQETKLVQLKLIGSLVKLAASKDVQAYQALEAVADPQQYAYAVHEPMDDESVARRMMDMYSERGIDPSLALSPDSDPLEDFGGTSAVFGAKE